MCLAVPGRIISIVGDKAIVDYIDEKREIDCSLLPCKVGDYVLVSNRIAIEKIPKKEAEESLKMYRDAVQ